jgi:putative Mg2+ transporter-C (MgtC) family protein
MIFTPEDLLKLFIAVVVGGMIGFERELHSKAAGLRTITLMTVGATLFTVLSENFSDTATARVAANIIPGIGFLGAGVILFSEGKLKGLTTASSIWVAAALGMAIGVGEYILAGATTILVLVVLTLFSRFDQLVDQIGRETRTYQVAFPMRDKKHAEMESIFRECRMRIRSRRRMKRDGALICIWELEGRAGDHYSLAEKLLADQEIIELQY